MCPRPCGVHLQTTLELNTDALFSGIKAVDTGDAVVERSPLSSITPSGIRAASPDTDKVRMAEEIELAAISDAAEEIKLDQTEQDTRVRRSTDAKAKLLTIQTKVMRSVARRKHRGHYAPNTPSRKTLPAALWPHVHDSTIYRPSQAPEGRVDILVEMADVAQGLMAVLSAQQQHNTMLYEKSINVADTGLTL